MSCCGTPTEMRLGMMISVLIVGSKWNHLSAAGDNLFHRVITGNVNGNYELNG